MHTEENHPPAEDFRYESAAQNPAAYTPPQETGGALASHPQVEDWSAFTPANDRLEDILLIPEEPLEAAEPVVQAEVLEDVFSVEVAEPAQAASESLVVAGGGEMQANVDEGSALHTSLAPSAEEPAPPVSLRAPAPAYDKYAVGMRILRVSPVWTLLSTFGFLSIIVLFGWMSRPAGKVEASALDAGVKNEATNQSLAQAAVPEAAPATAEAPAPAPTAAKEEPKPQASQEPKQQPQETRTQGVTAAEPSAAAGNFTIQVGSYPDASQANERD